VKSTPRPPRRPFRRWLVAGLVLGLAAAFAGCSTLAYYGQAVRGGLEVLCKRRAIETLLGDPALDAALRERLGLVRAIRDFAVADLALPDNGSYRSYADLGRPYAVWTVVAAPEFSVEPRLWCFPIAGCVSYRGYFARERAEDFAAELAAEGFDVEVGGVAAWSSLGWFSDPVLNTFVSRPEADLAGLLFHELAHQVVYVGGDTTFNESFASAVEAEGVRRWLLARDQGEQLAAWQEEQRQDEAVIALLLDARRRLAEAYASPEPEAVKRRRKAEIFAALVGEYERQVEPWGGSRWDGFLHSGLNNAHLASIGAYSELVPAFEALLARLGGDLPRFYAEVGRLGELSEAERRAILSSGSQPSQARTGKGGYLR